MRRSVARCQKGATGIEYALIASILGVGLLGGAYPLRNKTRAVYCSVAGKMSTAAGIVGACGKGAPAPAPEPEPMLIEWGMGIGSDEDHQCAYRYNYSTGIFDLDNRADNRGACSSNVTGLPSQLPDQERLDAYAKGGRNEYGTTI